MSLITFIASGSPAPQLSILYVDIFTAVKVLHVVSSPALQLSSSPNSYKLGGRSSFDWSVVVLCSARLGSVRGNPVGARGAGGYGLGLALDILYRGPTY